MDMQGEVVHEISFVRMIGDTKEDGIHILNVMLEPHIYRHSGDDYLRQFVVPNSLPFLFSNPLVLVYKIICDYDTVGVFLLQRKSGCAADIHTCILPVAYGKSVAICSAFRKYIFDELKWLTTVTTEIPVTNLLAIKLAIRAGFEQCGLFTEYWQLDGKLVDVFLYEMKALPKGD